jgi:hypothetical protein
VRVLPLVPIQREELWQVISALCARNIELLLVADVEFIIYLFIVLGVVWLQNNNHYDHATMAIHSFIIIILIGSSFILGEQRAVQENSQRIF